ncbi:MAG: 5-oxoprolinase subunit PxpB [Desulfobulbaceae bacterium]|nr:5-oxoprolinase subunit PxpB [Desulfobulbaceae bacterium]
MQANTAPSLPLLRLSGERCLLAEYGQEVDAAVNEKVRCIALLLSQAQHAGIDEIVSSYSTLALFYHPEQITIQKLEQLLRECEQKLAQTPVPEARTIMIPVCYGGVFGPDLDYVAQHNKLDAKAVIERHSAVLYRIYAIGFAPGFCYLGGLDESLHTPRLETPRNLVSAGSVGIAGSQTGIYSQDSPGGWRIIGRTPMTLFDADQSEPCPYCAGDNVRFQAVNEETYHAILAGKNA